MKKKIPWPVSSGPVIKATFIDRPNRFLVHCRNRELGSIAAHLPNPGRLWELFLPGSLLYLHETPKRKSSGKQARKTRYTVMAVERQGHPVFLQTHTTNQVAHYLLDNKKIPGLKKARVVKPEVTVGRSRFDFLLKKNGKDCYLEVKSCTLFGNGVAMFPDAVTERGRRHILELAEMARNGIPTSVLFLIHHPKITWFMPDFHTDLAFSEALLAAHRDIQVFAVALPWKKDLTIGPAVKKLPIPWSYLKKEVKDQGSYLLIVRLDKDRTCAVGKLGRQAFQKGYYVYVGSAMQKLNARISRHKKKEKKLQWHIDYLTTRADQVIALPIRSSQRLECTIGKAVAALLEPGPAGFGSSDCRCPTHLFFSTQNPLHSRDFHDMLHRFRMRHPD